MKTVNKNSIVASLQYGEIILISSCFILFLILFILSLFLLIIGAFFIEKLSYTYLFFLLLSILTVVPFIYFLKIKRKLKIKLWLEDAVEYKAKSKMIGMISSPGNVFIKLYRIQVQFNHNGKKITRDSGNPNGNGSDGYYAVYKDYINRTIRVLYSEKYDQILILEDY